MRSGWTISRFLGHADPLIAEDAFAEFGHASFAAVAEVAPHLPFDDFRRWIADPNYPGDRKGFLGLAIGLVKEGKQRQANRELLRRLAANSSDDFTGFDGILAGYLLIDGEPALADIDERYLANAEAAEANTWHAVRALRFYQEYGRGIAHARLCKSARLLLQRAPFAAAAITDLARWQDWDALPAIVKLYDPKSTTALATQRAIIGYLRACPNSTADVELARLRSLDPVVFKRAEAVLSLSTQ